tara:strand:- start:175 stop:396 length:222 start_codon:yes stop_codon:yes gene_type:complete
MITNKRLNVGETQTIKTFNRETKDRTAIGFVEHEEQGLYIAISAAPHNLYLGHGYTKKAARKLVTDYHKSQKA